MIDNNSLSDIRTLQSIFILLLTSTLFVSFTDLSQIPLAGYILLALTFVFVSLVGSKSNSKFQAVFTIFLLSFGVKLIVIDPVEIGLYAGDPAGTYKRLLKFQATSDLGSLLTDVDWPLLYVFTDLMATILGIKTIITAKYLPLVSILVPVFFYLFARLVSSHKSAHFSTLGVIVLRNTAIFHSKFVDETIAIGFSFLCLYLIMFAFTQSTGWSRRVIGLALISATALVLSHPMAALLSGGIILAISIAAGYRDPPLIHTKTEYEFRAGITISLLIIISVTGLYVFTVLNSSAGFFASPVPTKSGAPSIGGSTTMLEDILIALSVYGHVLVIGLLSLIVLLGTISKRVPTSQWDVAWAIIGGILTGLYAGQVLVGRLLGYDPVRYLIFFIPFILLYSMKVIESQKIRQYSPTKRTVMQITLIMLVVVTQISAIAPHVMYSDPSTKPLDAKGHFTPSDYSMIDFSTNYVSEDIQVIAYETPLWKYDNKSIWVQTSLRECNNTLVANRDGAPELIRGGEKWKMDRIYTNSQTKLSLCGGS
jgi:hypothetical protein